jgi:hypothetical protein
MAHGALYSAVGRLALPENWPRAPCTAALRGDTPTNAVDSFRPFGFRGEVRGLGESSFIPPVWLLSP